MAQRPLEDDDGEARGIADPVRWVVLASALLFLGLAWPALSGDVYAGNDLDRFHLPLRWFYANALEAGQAFDWMPSLFSGFYLTGEGQAGTWHPLHLLLYRTLPLVAAFDVEVLASYVLLFAGTWLLLRRPRTDDENRIVAGLPEAAALLGAMLFTFCASTMLHFVHVNAVAVVAHLPWNLLAIEESLRPTGPRPARSRLLAMLALAALTASAWLCGYPQYVWIVGCAELAWILLVLVPTAGLRDAVAIAGVGGAKLLGTAMAAIQLLPTLEQLQGARRYVLAEDLSGAGSLHPLNLVQLVGPYLFDDRALGDHPHEYGVYAGAVPLLLVAWSLGTPGTVSSSRRTRGLAILAVVALGLAFGRYAGTDRLQAMLPLVGAFRFPARFLFLFHFAVALLAAEAFAKLLERGAVRSRHPGWALATAAVAIAAAASRTLEAAMLAPTALVLAGPALFVAAAIVFRAVLRGRRFAVPALILLAALDSGAYGLSAWAWPASRPLAAILAEVPELPSAHARIATLQPQALGHYTGNVPVMLGAGMFDGYAGLPQAAHPSPVTLEDLRLAAVDCVERTTEGVPLDGLRPGPDGWFTVPSPRPRVRLATRAVVADDAARALRESAGRDSPSVVFTSQPFPLSDPPGRVLAVDREPGRIRVRADVPAQQMLVVAERFHAGWRASVNGAATAVHPVDGGLLGVEIAPGASDVELVFAPRSLVVGRAISLVSLAAWCLLAAAAVVRTQAANDDVPGARQ